MRSSRSNPLALAVMVCLLERPMHPYEVATTLRQRAKERSVKLNYGALYGVVDSLRKRGLIEPRETERAGRLPERTIYQLTDAGEVEVSDWLGELLASPFVEYPQFVAALSFLPAVPPDHALQLLRERLQRLGLQQAQDAAAIEHVQKMGLPRLLWIEEQYRACLLAAEIDFVQSLVRDLERGALEGLEWWRAVHGPDGDQVPPPFHDNLHHDRYEEG